MAENADPGEEQRAILSQPLTNAVFEPLSSLIDVDIAAASDRGLVAYHNTDHYLAVRLGRSQETLVTSLAAEDLPRPFSESAYAMLIADGVGEHGVGGRASRVAVSALAHLAIQFGRWHVRVEPDTFADIAGQSDFLFRQANDAVIDASRADFRLAEMATSMTAVYIAGADLFFAHVGHSRAYVFRDGSLIQLTHDHTHQPPAHGASPAPLHARLDLQHVVTETVGGRRGGPQVEVEHVQLWSGDRVLLCTNGLTDAVTEDRIADVLALRRSPPEECGELIELALEAGRDGDDRRVLGPP
jgi:protein phosphatase